ncbi:hypothetical protein [Pseudarthrobacter sp. BRE9]|uniref:hypothetical protein n=1 Tax=Pseudarthrobacter sp. BRE9 TaxID=2962582 RepID=UPI00288235E4|nr:hypothetical protein [Pseudarthrobacter sp. BRE9]MDT0171012.1 hypothetical protein [Pseudarthrobacter sp. BRE9]
MSIRDPKVRAYIYGIVLAAIPLLQFFRLVPGEAIPLVVNVVTAVLGVGAAGLALPNTPNAPVAPVVNVYSTVDPEVTAEQVSRRINQTGV